MTWQGKSVQCCSCSKWVHLRCLQLSFNNNLRSSPNSEILTALTLGAATSCCVPTRNTVTLFSYSSDMYTSTVQSIPSSVNAAPSNFLSPVGSFCIFSICPLITAPCSWLSFYASCLSSPLIFSGFSNRMVEVFEPGALNYFTFSRRILLILSVARNPILTHPPFSGFRDSLLCVLIAPTPGLAFSLS